MVPDACVPRLRQQQPGALDIGLLRPPSGRGQMHDDIHAVHRLRQPFAGTQIGGDPPRPASATHRPHSIAVLLQPGDHDGPQRPTRSGYQHCRVFAHAVRTNDRPGT